MGDRASIRFRLPKSKVRKGEQAKVTKVHDSQVEEYEPTGEKGAASVGH